MPANEFSWNLFCDSSTFLSCVLRCCPRCRGNGSFIDFGEGLLNHPMLLHRRNAIDHPVAGESLALLSQDARDHLHPQLDQGSVALLRRRE